MVMMGIVAVIAAATAGIVAAIVCLVAAIAAIAIVINTVVIVIAASVTVDVAFQGAQRGIDRALITALKRLDEARQVVCDVAGEH